MIKLFRLLLGQSGSAGKRTVVGQAVAVDPKEVKYIQDSSARLNLLNNLCTKYKGTPQEPKIKSVYEKTKSIHTYLVAKKRGPELELFHLQHTDHFINTFSIIIEVHQRYQESIVSSAQSNHQTPENIPLETAAWQESGSMLREPVRRVGSPPVIHAALKTEAAVAELLIPVISINTYARIPYIQGEILGAMSAREIGFTSSETEKEKFLEEVRARLGIKNIVYLGNALVNLPPSNGATANELVPVIRWQSCLYALNLKDYRLFPVKINW